MHLYNFLLDCSKLSFTMQNSSHVKLTFYSDIMTQTWKETNCHETKIVYLEIATISLSL